MRSGRRGSSQIRLAAALILQWWLAPSPLGWHHPSNSEVAASLTSFGDIESICQTDDLAAGKTARLVFRTWDDASPPFTVKVKDPDGKTILDRVIRELPTGKPQSAPPLTFSVMQVGAYQITIRELYGKKEGEATLAVS